ncbi:LADA_0G02168g1_1 [Lachancea dasiensis]|uniref:LADA_0G02168g1_1 n=1 Tax=Lachancea dasiensis TaxID=1072105 RepID=A0A1G4JR38_9SACH|nr:LADA_0G02168g1_1 [Lachancea dasiensis]
MVNVAFLAPLGTYTHQAALQQFPEDKHTTFTPVDSISKCFQELMTNKELDFAVVPLENSTNGQVVFTYDILRDLMNNSDTYQENEAVPMLEIVAEQYVSIDLCLIASKPLNLNSLTKETKLEIHSHPQVWGQAANYLKLLEQKVSALHKIDASSTSAAVRLCCEMEGEEQGGVISLAVGSSIAAKAHNGFVLDSRINDKKGNTTRFLILKRRNSQGPPLEARPFSPLANDQMVSILTFVVKQDSPGSLVDVLNVLKEHRINMCSITSRPYHFPKDDRIQLTPENEEGRWRKWQYIFFVEVTHDNRLDWAPVLKGIRSNSMRFCFWGTLHRNGRYYDIT